MEKKKTKAKLRKYRKENNLTDKSKRLVNVVVETIIKIL